MKLLVGFPRSYFPLAILVIVLSVLLPAGACAGRVNLLTIERPNARTNLEERSYNLLTTSETLLDAADTCRASVDCEIASFMVPVLNLLVAAHNAGRLVALEYDAFLDAGGTTADAELEARLATLILDLDVIIRQVVTGGGAQ